VFVLLLWLLLRYVTIVIIVIRDISAIIVCIAIYLVMVCNTDMIVISVMFITVVSVVIVIMIVIMMVNIAINVFDCYYCCGCY